MAVEFYKLETDRPEPKLLLELHKRRSGAITEAVVTKVTTVQQEKLYEDAEAFVPAVLTP